MKKRIYNLEKKIGGKMNIQDFENLSRQRCSHRKLLEDAVPDHDIKKIVEIATTAPSGHNNQPWKFIAIKSGEKKKELAMVMEKRINEIKNSVDDKLASKLDKFSFFIMHFKDAPVVLAVLGRKDEYISTKLRDNAGGAMPEPEHFDTELVGIGAAIQNALLAATAMGYGSCWLTAPINYAQKELEQVLELEQGYHLNSLLTIGKPTKHRKQPERKGVDEVLTFM